MNRKKKIIGLLLCAGIVILAIYCAAHAIFINLHVCLAEQEDLKLFPEIGREIKNCLIIMLCSVFVLAGATSFLLLKENGNGIKK